MQPSVTTLTVMTETHVEVQSSYPPAPEFAANANATAELYDEAEADRLAFWAEQANRLSWETPFTEVLDWSDAPFAKWFVGGKLNVAYNCVDRHVEAGNGDRVAIHWEGEPVDDARDDHLRAAQRRSLPGRQRPHRARPESPATGSPSTCRWCPRPSSRCWPAHGWAPCTRWCSPVSPPPRCGPASTTPRPSSSSPPTGSSAAARRCR